MKLKFLITLTILVLLIILALFWPGLNLNSAEGQFIFWNLRLPRVLLALLVGASLTLSGVVYQTVFKNPLAEPYLLGVSAGAATGAATALILGFSFSFYIFNSVSVLAFSGGLGAVGLVYLLAIIRGQLKTEKLILLGVGVSAVFTAILSLVIILSDQLRSIYFWLLGSLVNASWEKVFLLTGYFLISFLIILFYSRKMDILKLTDDEAYSLGVDVFQTQLFLIFIATLLTALAVSFCGIIGFVGLLGPHMARLLFGQTNIKLLPGAVLVGTIFLLAADTLSRSLLYPTELPLGIITAFIGAPYFIFLLTRQETR